MPTIHTISSREFGQNVSNAKHLAKEGPLFITTRGEPAFVLLDIEKYRELAGGKKEMSLLDLMDSLPDTSEVADFNIEPMGIDLRRES